MATGDTLVWHGGQHTVVELDREVNCGDEIVVEDAGLRDRLLRAGEFTLKDGTNPFVQTEPDLAPRSALEDLADHHGLAIYPTESDAGLADRIKSAGGDPTEAGARAASGKKPTPKQEAVARANELSIDASGTEAEIRERITAEEERLAQDQGGSTGGGD